MKRKSGSFRWQAGIVTGVMVLALAGCKSSGHLAPIEQLDQPPTIRLHHHTVSKGDTLYSISWRYGMDYRQLAQLNGIQPPYTIYVGQKVRLGDESVSGRIAESSPGVQVTAVADTSAGVTEVGGVSEVSPVVAPEEASPAPTSAATAPVAPPPVAAASPSSRSGQWQWPTRGKILSRFVADDPLRKGIDLEGKLGEPVHAASAGSVVYAGSGLTGYGQLVIIKHDERYLSAYGHNSKLLVKEGDAVKAGQVIAEVGASGTDSNKLHFEIRSAGKPVDPLQYLPAR